MNETMLQARLCERVVPVGRGADALLHRMQETSVPGDPAFVSEAPSFGAHGTLYLALDDRVMEALRMKGIPCACVLPEKGTAPDFAGAKILLSSPWDIDAGDFEKIYRRLYHLPWIIGTTPRLLLREMMLSDIPALYALYDGEAKRYLPPLPDDPEEEKKILRAYIDRIYGLYGFGHWAVVLKDRPDKLIGRIGFSALTSRQEEEAERFGVPAPDADFGFLVGPEWRGLGLAEEVCRALLQYGFSQLGFTCIRADADNNNAASIHLLEKLGFLPVGKAVFEQSGKTAERTVFISVREDPH